MSPMRVKTPTEGLPVAWSRVLPLLAVGLVLGGVLVEGGLTASRFALDHLRGVRRDWLTGESVKRGLQEAADVAKREAAAARVELERERALRLDADQRVQELAASQSTGETAIGDTTGGDLATGGTGQETSPSIGAEMPGGGAFAVQDSGGVEPGAAGSSERPNVGSAAGTIPAAAIPEVRRGAATAEALRQFEELVNRNEVISASQHLLAAVRLGRTVPLQALHHHRGFSGDGFCSGELRFSDTGVSYSATGPGREHAFDIAWSLVTEIVDADYGSAGRSAPALRLKGYFRRESESTMNFFPPSARVRDRQVECSNCKARVYSVLLAAKSLKEAGSARQR